MQTSDFQCPTGLSVDGPYEFSGNDRNWVVLYGILFYIAGAMTSLLWVSKDLVGLSFAVPAMFLGLTILHCTEWIAFTFDLRLNVLRVRKGNFVKVTFLRGGSGLSIPFSQITGVNVELSSSYRNAKNEPATEYNRYCHVELFLAPEWKALSPFHVTTVIGVENAEISRREWEAFLRQLPEVQQL